MTYYKYINMFTTRFVYNFAKQVPVVDVTAFVGKQSNTLT